MYVISVHSVTLFEKTQIPIPALSLAWETEWYQRRICKFEKNLRRPRWAHSRRLYIRFFLILDISYLSSYLTNKKLENNSSPLKLTLISKKYELKWIGKSMRRNWSKVCHVKINSCSLFWSLQPSMPKKVLQETVESEPN